METLCYRHTEVGFCAWTRGSRLGGLYYCLSLAAYLARFKGHSRLHTESDLLLPVLVPRPRTRRHHASK
jgi:hypothetical protein